MLGSSLTITLDGSGGTAKVLPLINQDGYSSEYFLNETLETFRATVRHSSDTVRVGDRPRDRHTVTFERKVKPTTTYPSGLTASVSFTILTDPDFVAADVIDVSEAMSFYMVKAGGIAAKLLGWES